ncbi:MAG TPA: dTDP-4-dehydrorhamnose 3,5-epimerase [Beijerinckia sp.]|jgi:dTDP-4-dehydrorhamnose 3,5-epimerase|nr:dTDP-4-dehydrorhamnose 3,5-epimerase [Beijerinckia sp.]
MTSLVLETAAIPGLVIATPKKFGDHRGFFSEVYNRKLFSETGFDFEFVQDNHSLSAQVGTIRGLHFQAPPFAQDKLIRVIRGRIFDVAVDIRRSSPTYGQHVAVELSAENWKQFLVPAGFAHGFCTLEPDTEVMYKVSNYYSPAHDGGLAWDDPALAIPWPVEAGKAILSDKDRQHPCLKDLSVIFD